MSELRLNGDEAAAHALDSAWVRRSFDRASTTYDAAAVLQREVRGHLLERLDLTRLAPGHILDAGAGTGHASRALKRRYPKALVLAVDSALGMLRGRRVSAILVSTLRQRLCGCGAAAAPGRQRRSRVLSNLMLPWCDPDAVFAEFRRVLAPRAS